MISVSAIMLEAFPRSSLVKEGMKRLLVVYAVIIAFSSIAFAEKNKASSSAKIKIGVCAPLTGEAATYGLDIKDYLVFANSKYGNNRFELIFEDDRCSGKEAVTIAHKLINVDKVDYALGFACSGTILAAAPIYEAAKLPTVVSGASSPKVADAGDYIFRTAPSDKLAATVLAKYVAKQDEDIAIFSEETEYAQDLDQAFVEAMSSYGKSVIRESFLPNTTDFRSVLLRLKASNPKGLFINSQAERTFAVILKQLGQLKWSPRIYGAYWPGTKVLRDLAGEELEGVVFVDTPSLDTLLNGSGRSLLSEYRASGGKTRSIEALFASTIEAFRSIEAASKSDLETIDFLNQAKFDGVFGNYSFDEKGEVVGLGFKLKQIANGEIVTIG